jgi:hypothetical protein
MMENPLRDLVFFIHVSAYIVLYNGGEPWMYIYGRDYIKFLNDHSTGLLTYDQWKNKSSLKGTNKRNLTERVKTTRYTEGNYSQSVFNRNI